MQVAITTTHHLFWFVRCANTADCRNQTAASVTSACVLTASENVTTAETNSVQCALQSSKIHAKLLILVIFKLWSKSLLHGGVLVNCIWTTGMNTHPHLYRNWLSSPENNVIFTQRYKIGFICNSWVFFFIWKISFPVTNLSKIIYTI